MSWNYRIVENECGAFFLAEVYYNADGSLSGWAPLPDGNFEEDSLEELKAELVRVQAAFIKPVLRLTQNDDLIEVPTPKK